MTLERPKICRCQGRCRQCPDLLRDSGVGQCNQQVPGPMDLQTVADWRNQSQYRRDCLREDCYLMHLSFVQISGMMVYGPTSLVFGVVHNCQHYQKRTQSTLFF